MPFKLNTACGWRQVSLTARQGRGTRAREKVSVALRHTPGRRERNDEVSVSRNAINTDSWTFDSVRNSDWLHFLSQYPRAVEDLSQQVLGHATMRIDQQINHLLMAAVQHCESNRELMESRRFSEKDYPRFALDSIEVMRQHRWFNSVGFTQSETGDGWYVKRESDGKLVVIEGRWNDKVRKLALKVYADKDLSARTRNNRTFSGRSA